MPGTQIIDSINKSKFMSKIDDLDKIHLLCIGLKKNNTELLNMINIQDNSLRLKDIRIVLLMVQDLLADYEYNSELQPYFNLFLKNIDFKPIRLFHNYIDRIFLLNPEEKMNKIYSVLSLFKDFPEYKKDFIHLLIYRLTQTEDEQNDLLSFIYQK